MNERPASVENRRAEGPGNIERGQTRRTERRHEQDELKVRHLGRRISSVCMIDGLLPEALEKPRVMMPQSQMVELETSA